MQINITLRRISQSMYSLYSDYALSSLVSVTKHKQKYIYFLIAELSVKCVIVRKYPNRKVFS